VVLKLFSLKIYFPSVKVNKICRGNGFKPKDASTKNKDGNKTERVKAGIVSPDTPFVY